MAPPAERTEPWTIPTTRLAISIHDDRADVSTWLDVRPQRSDDAGWLTLDGIDLTLHDVRVDGRPPAGVDVEHDEEALRLRLPPGPHLVRVDSRAPIGERTMGIGRYGDIVASACEPEGFRRIAFGRDHPARRSVYDVTVEGDADRHPVLLSGGRRVGRGSVPGGRHWARFVDPLPKPAYLVSFVAGPIERRERIHRSIGGRPIRLRVAAPAHLVDGADHALDVLDRTMSWDERRGHPPFDLDTLTLAGIPGYVLWASETHGLMMFDTECLLADTAGHTDDDLEPITVNVAHEYFHHVHGVRVGISSWADLALKEGLTTLAQQDFDIAVEGPSARLAHVARLRRLQFPEETATRFPVRPAADAAADAAYTRTAYFKAAEIFAMLRRAVGVAAWEEAMRDFEARYDLGDASIDDLVSTVAEHAPDPRLVGGLARWLDTPGRPTVTVAASRGGDGGIVLSRTDDVDVPVPIAIDDARRGDGLVVLGAPGSEARLPAATSVLRGLSAPVDVTLDLPDDRLAARALRDDDPMARRLAIEALFAHAVDAERGRAVSHAVDHLTGVFDAVLDAPADPLLSSRLISPPDEHLLGDRETPIDVDGIHRAAVAVVRRLGARLAPRLRRILGEFDPQRATGDSAARRALAAVCLGYLVELGADVDEPLLRAHLDSPDPTTAARAFVHLAHHDRALTDEYSAVLEGRWRGAPRLIDWWVRAQTGSRRASTEQRVTEIVAGPHYDRASRTRVFAVWLPFVRNRVRFHDVSGAGYRRFVDEAIELLVIDPGAVPLLVGDLVQFGRFDAVRRELMAAELSRLHADPRVPPAAQAAIGELLRSGGGA